MARGFFSAPPLNYETLARRLALFHKRRATPSLLADYIRANRQLQRTNNQTRHLSPGQNDLGLKVNVASSTLEKELWAVMRRYWPMCVASDLVVQTYVLSADNVDIGPAFSLVAANHKQHSQDLLPGVMALVALLLRRNDYHGCFKLLDITLNSAELKEKRRGQWLSTLGLGIIGATGAGAFVSTCLPLTPWLLSFGVASVCVLGPFFGFRTIEAAAQGARVAWRPRTGFFHRWSQRHEWQLVNRIITSFEEHHEVNGRNFHTSEVRRAPSLAMFDLNDYELHLPQSRALTFPGENFVADERADELARYFRGELQRRRMVWNVLEEERMFIECWLAQGENYFWGEPDQDPAEMVQFHSRAKY